MKKLQYKSLQSFVQDYDLKQINQDDLIISDIDGVFFKGIFDFREILGIISPDNIMALEKLLQTKAGLWIFTNRLFMFRHFPFIKQITKTIKKSTNTEIILHPNCHKFLESRLQNYTIIMNAGKPKPASQEVVVRAIKNFRNILYIGAQDTPFAYSDASLIKNLQQKIPLSNLTFIDIGA